MVGLIIDGFVIYWAYTMCKKFHTYFVKYWNIFDKQNEFIEWKKNRLPILKQAMQGKIFTVPEGGAEGEHIEVPSTHAMWALAERLARSNHMRKDWSRFGPIKESQYDF